MHTLTNDVWLVDDDEEDLFLMQAALLEVAPGLQLVMLSDGEALLPQLATAKRLPSLVLLDINMPIINGFDALRELRGSDRYPQLPVVMLTTSNSAFDRIQCERLGASEFCTKPASFSEMIQLARRLVQQWILKATA